MQINALRNELTVLLMSQETGRPPALRRSGEAEWLYATDIPALLSGTAKERLIIQLNDAGWEHAEKEGWMLLRKPVAEPPEKWFAGSFGPEAGCCLSLLQRHESIPGDATETAKQALIKAGETGEKAYEETCFRLHREWAERLRKGTPLPAISLTFFGG